ncbi:MAG TPA: 4a-hydroxytetrahydrobiopterin dehydratase [Pilimelia sp.]|nr:4a-hydroxytetrahydrobiopterin dehydratase [Pilimelia sp.]
MRVPWSIGRRPDYLAEALELLAGWTRQGCEIHRRLALDDSQHAALTERVSVIADALQIRPHILRRDGHTLIRLHSPDDRLHAGTVTLAARIEAAYRVVTAGPTT